MADRDAKKLERQLDRISAGLPSGVGGFLRWLRSPLSRWVRIPAGLLLIIGGVVGFVGVGILDGAAWRPAACAGPPLPPTAGNENVSNGRVRGHVYRGTGILNNSPGRLETRSRPMGRKLKNRCLVGKNARFRILQKLTSKPFRAMSALGQKRTLERRSVMSALGVTPDIRARQRRLIFCRLSGTPLCALLCR